MSKYVYEFNPAPDDPTAMDVMCTKCGRIIANTEDAWYRDDGRFMCDECHDGGSHG